MIAPLRSVWERVSIYLPIVLMGLLALGTYWLVRSTPVPASTLLAHAPGHEPDYFMRDFSVRTFDEAGQLKSEVTGVQARHYPDTDVLEIEQVHIRSYGEDGRLTTATALRALSNGDGSEVQLLGQARVVREAVPGKRDKAQPRLSFEGEFLHVFMRTERVVSHKPVLLTRGQDHFSADRMDFDNLSRVMALQGRVKGTLMPSPAN